MPTVSWDRTSAVARRNELVHCGVSGDGHVVVVGVGQKQRQHNGPGPHQGRNAQQHPAQSDGFQHTPSVPADRARRHPGWRGTAVFGKYPQSVSQGSGETGRVLGGRYRLVSRIGAGRFTHVYLAYDLAQSRRVAVKLLSEEVLPDEWARSSAFASRFLEAAEVAAATAHPHLAAVYDWGESEIGLYVVGDYLEGGSLQGMLRARQLLSPSQALMVGLEVARGLEHIHRQGLVHRDVRPSNILFDSRGRSRLADLGTSWVLTSSETGGTLMSRSVFSAIDAVRYASPEQAQGLSADHKSDVYSLVLVLTEALSGRVPFESDDPDDTQMAKMSRQLDLAGQFDRLGRVLEMAGRPERDERPSAHDLSRACWPRPKRCPAPRHSRCRRRCRRSPIRPRRPQPAHPVAEPRTRAARHERVAL